jgi:hypothetical protein
MAQPGFLQRIRNYVFPTPGNGLKGAAWPVGNASKNLRNYITPVQMQRIRHDVQMWRDSINEAEHAWFPHRVKMQRMYIDTILSGHTQACVRRRKNLTLLKDFAFVNETGYEHEALKKLFSKKWFSSFLEYALDAQFFGYSLVSLGDVVGDDFPNLSIIPRYNISPDRLNVASYVYSISGAQFFDEPYKDWHIWVPTNTDAGISKVGYGVLYSVAVYEIMARNMLGNNADAVELYGMPLRVGKTQKIDESERGNFEIALQNMGSAGYILLDTFDELELIESKSMGQGYKIFPDFEQRLEKKISKIILGHADAMDSVPGKLGAAQGDDNPAAVALRDTQTVDGSFLEDVVNTSLLPKLVNLGFNIPQGYRFCFRNNQELEAIRARQDQSNKLTADIAYTMKQAGLEMDAAYFEQRTGIPTAKSTE